MLFGDVVSGQLPHMSTPLLGLKVNSMVVAACEGWLPWEDPS